MSSGLPAGFVSFASAGVSICVTFVKAFGEVCAATETASNTPAKTAAKILRDIAAITFSTFSPFHFSMCVFLLMPQRRRGSSFFRPFYPQALGRMHLSDSFLSDFSRNGRHRSTRDRAAYFPHRNRTFRA